MALWARIQNGVVAELTDTDPAGRYHTALQWAPAPPGTVPGMGYDGTGYHPPAPPPAAPAGPRYVSLATIRERLTASGLWPDFAAALDGLTPDQRWHLLSLREGVASDDPDAVALLGAIGADPDAVLRSDSAPNDLAA